MDRLTPLTVNKAVQAIILVGEDLRVVWTFITQRSVEYFGRLEHTQEGQDKDDIELLLKDIIIFCAWMF